MFAFQYFCSDYDATQEPLKEPCVTLNNTSLVELFPTASSRSFSICFEGRGSCSVLLELVKHSAVASLWWSERFLLRLRAHSWRVFSNEIVMQGWKDLFKEEPIKINSYGFKFSLPFVLQQNKTLAALALLMSASPNWECADNYAFFMLMRQYHNFNFSFVNELGSLRLLRLLCHLPRLTPAHIQPALNRADSPNRASHSSVIIGRDPL